MNQRNPAVKRIQADVRELDRHPSSRYSAAPLDENMFEWHFTIRGPAGSDFEGGIYHGRILLPAHYPFKPPNIVFLTRNGRFEVGTKICLSISAYHEESWQPAWGVRTMLEALISFLPSEGAGAIGALDWSREERQRLAVESRSYSCPTCGLICNLVTDPTAEESTNGIDKDIAAQIAQLRMQASSADDNAPNSARTTSATTSPLKPTLASPTATIQASDTAVMSEKAEPPRIDISASASSSSHYLSAAAPPSPQRRSQVNNNTIDAFASYNTPRDASALDQGTPPSLRIIRRRILHSRHGAEYQHDETDISPANSAYSSRSSSPPPPASSSLSNHQLPNEQQHNRNQPSYTNESIQQPEQHHNQQVAHDAQQQQHVHTPAIARGADGVDVVREPIAHSWEDYALLLAMAAISFILMLLLIRKFKRLLEGGLPSDSDEL